MTTIEDLQKHYQDFYKSKEHRLPPTPEFGNKLPTRKERIKAICITALIAIVPIIFWCIQ